MISHWLLALILIGAMFATSLLVVLVFEGLDKIERRLHSPERPLLTEHVSGAQSEI